MKIKGKYFSLLVGTGFAVLQPVSTTQAQHVMPRVAEADSRFSRNYPGLLASLGFAAFLLVSSPALAAVPPPLGTLQQFGVLGAAGVTGQTGSGAAVNGDVGSNPTPAVSNFPPSTVLPPFVLHLAIDAVTTQAHSDAIAASAFLLAQGPGSTIPDQLGGTTVTPGVYSFTSGAADIAAGTTLTLDGAGTYIFLVGSSITANVLSDVVLQNGANPCNVFWRVQASATLNGIHFPGTVIAGASVTVGDNAILAGRAVALVGAVTMPGDGGTTIGGCSGAVPPPSGVALSKGFLPTTINAGGVSILTITLSNANATVATLTSPLTDPLPSGVVIAPTPHASTTCGIGGIGGGVVSATPGTGTVSLSTNSTIPGGTPGTCSVTVNVTAPAVGSFLNTLAVGALMTTNGNNTAPAFATLIVVLLLPPSAIPTLSEWAMIMLAALLVLFGVARIRRHAM